MVDNSIVDSGSKMKMNSKIISNTLTSAIGYHDHMDPFVKDIFPLLLVYRLMARCPFKTNKYGRILN